MRISRRPGPCGCPFPARLCGRSGAAGGRQDSVNHAALLEYEGAEGTKKGPDSVPKRATSLAAAMLGLVLAGMLPAAAQVSAGASGANAPVATDARVGGDAKQTRFVVDLTRKVDIR